MAIDIQQIINSSFGVNILSTVAGWIPIRLGYRLADFVAELIVAHPGSRMVRAVRANQWVISGERLDKEALDRAVHETYRNSARSIFDLYHYIRNPGTLEQRVVLSATVQQLIQRPEFEQRGVIVAGLHISNFDLFLRALTLRGLRAMVLTIPDPQGSQRVEYEMRKKTGMNLIPTTFSSLRRAIGYLQQGGMVMTGIDRPIPRPKHRPLFFGRPADLPMHHVYLATKAHVPVMVMATIRQPDGKNHFFTSEPIEMESCPDTDMEMLRNAEKVLSIGEDFIRRAPSQWSISLPIWPEALNQTPI
jgi:phosphatidylinositol dimannoside acyltransferase